MSSAATSADVMDGIYRYQRHIYDLTRRHYLLGRNNLIATLQPPSGGSILEVGCGTARNLILTARRYPEAQLYGLDISAEMLKSAEANIRANNLEHRIRVAKADATRFEAEELFGKALFDRVFCSYSLSMIPNWQSALQQACQAVAAGGELHVVDFGQQNDLPAWFGKALKAWLARFHVTPRDQLGEAMAQLATRNGGSLSFRSIYRDYARIGTIRLL